jgi:hypothetical protein
MKHGRCAVVGRWRVPSCPYVDFFPASRQCQSRVSENVYAVRVTLLFSVKMSSRDAAAFSSGGSANNRKEPSKESRVPVVPQECCVWTRKFETALAWISRTLCKAKLSVKMECTQSVLIPSASSQMVTWRSCMTKVRTWSMSSSFRLVEGLPERASLSSDVWPSLNRLYHSLICVMPMPSLPKPTESFERFPLGYRQASGKI